MIPRDAFEPIVLEVVIPGPLIRTEELGAGIPVSPASAPITLSAISVENIKRDPD